MDRRGLEGHLTEYRCQLDSELSLPDRARCLLLQALSLVSVPCCLGWADYPLPRAARPGLVALGRLCWCVWSCLCVFMPLLCVWVAQGHRPGGRSVLFVLFSLKYLIIHSVPAMCVIQSWLVQFIFFILFKTLVILYIFIYLFTNLFGCMGS